MNSISPFRYFPGALCAFLCVLCVSLSQASAISVSLSSPSEGATVSGQINVTGTAADLGGGRVSVSIDGGPFTLAQGTTTWTWAWNSITVTDGAHTITARARLSQQDPNPVFDTVDVTVDNSGAPPPPPYIPPTQAECDAMTPGTALPFPNAAAPATLDFPGEDTIELWIIGHSENRGYHTFLQEMLNDNPIAGKTFIVRNDWIGGHEAFEWATPGSSGYNKIETHLPELTHPTIALVLTSNNATHPIGFPAHGDTNFDRFVDDCESIAEHLRNGGSGVAMAYFSSHRYKVTNTLPSYYEKFAVAALIERFEQDAKGYLKAGPEQHDLHYCVFPAFYDPDMTHTNALGDELMAQTWYNFLANEFAPAPPGTTFNQWMTANGHSDPLDDPERNTINNKLTYVTGADLAANPLDALPAQSITAADTGGGVFQSFLTIDYRLRNDASDVSIMIEGTAGLQSWMDVTSQFMPVGTVDMGDGTSTITLRDTSPLVTPAGPFYCRVRYLIAAPGSSAP